MRPPIPVTRPHLPPLGELIPYLEDIWSTHLLTNFGPLHCRLENELAEHLGVNKLSLVANGTLALLIALKALGVRGEVITTPFTFVATSHALKWMGLEPVFVDIDPSTLNLDPELVEAAVTSKTTAMLPVHCYGTPCDTEKIGRLALRNNLKVIYDAAHAFGVSDEGGSILRHGDISILSLHATKVFHTGEGGALVCNDQAIHEKISSLRNFGILDEVTVDDVGINAKMPEMSAALGLALLRHAAAATERRRQIDSRYRLALGEVEGLKCLGTTEAGATNYGYFPILIDDAFGCDRDNLYCILRDEGINARRYFYPLISDLPMYADNPTALPSNLPVARKVARQIICLPIFAEMTDEEQDRVIDKVRRYEK